MGRRATSTTKGGKFMNPTDQARKEARRKELRKNKQQRNKVRSAVIKTKDPQVMIKELEDLDDLELNSSKENQYNDKVVKEKRRKLLETLIRIVDFYFKEEPARGREFKMMIEEYKLKRARKEMYFESVRSAEDVEVTSIPLPEAPFETPQLMDIPLPGVKPQGILKKPTHDVFSKSRSQKQPPGPPPGVPPSKKVFVRSASSKNVTKQPAAHYSDHEDFNDERRESRKADVDEEDEDEFHHRDDEDFYHRRIGLEDKDDKNAGSSNVTPLQAMMLKLAGQNVSSGLGPVDKDVSHMNKQDDKDAESSRKRPPGPPPGMPPGPPPGKPPRNILPPGPPPGRPPIAPTVPPHRTPMQLPILNPNIAQENSNILSAPPSLIQRPVEPEPSKVPVVPSIVAQPQLTGSSKGDVIRFMPTSLLVRRNAKASKAPSKPASAGKMSANYSTKQKTEKKRKNNKSNADVAYDSFMKEMQDLL